MSRPPDPRLHRRERSPEAHRLGEILDGLLRERPLVRGLPLGRLARHWEAVVGPKLAEVTAPVRLEEGVLWVVAETQGWAAQVRFLAGDVARRANEALGSDRIAKVQVSVGKSGREGR